MLQVRPRGADHFLAGRRAPLALSAPAPSPLIPIIFHHLPSPSITFQVYLDPKEAPNVEYKVDTFGTVYKKLTGKEVKFEFPVAEGHQPLGH